VDTKTIVNERLRENINQFITNEGIKARYICETLNIDESIFCRWRKGQKSLSSNTLNDLIKFLQNKGVMIDE